MAYYLQMDGVDDRLVAPSVTYNKIVLDASVTTLAVGRQQTVIRAAPSGSYYFNSTGTALVNVNIDVDVDGAEAHNLVAGQRHTIELTFTDATDRTGAVNIFADGSFYYTIGKMYSIKIFNGATLAIHYDMTLGNVQDQSGNGRHATLTGGTWVNESSGTTQEGASSVTGVSTLSASATVILAAVTGSASLQGVATISATADVVTPSLTGSASLTGVGSVTATANVIRAGSAVLQGVSTLTANAAGLSVLGGAFLTGVGWLMATAIEGTEHVNKIKLFASEETTLNLYTSEEFTIYLYDRN